MSPTPRVLVVEDEHDIAILIKHALERGGDADVEIVGSGDTALRSAAELPPDLVILDLNLPVLSGTEVCRILRARPATAATPILMLTARTSESDRVAGLDLGADDYVSKPFSLRELAARVRALLRRSRQTGAPAASVYAGAHLRADFDAVAVSVDGEAGTAHPPRVRVAALPRGQQEPRALAGSPARTGVGVRAIDRDAIGRRPRRPAPRKTGLGRLPDRNRRRPRLPVRRIGRARSRQCAVSARQPLRSRASTSSSITPSARSTRCQSV